MLAFPINNYEGKITLIQSVELLSAYDITETKTAEPNKIYQYAPLNENMMVAETPIVYGEKKSEE